MREALTEAKVERLKAAPGQRIEVFDAVLSGLCLRVAGPSKRSPEGRKSWCLYYRHAGSLRRLTITPPFPATSVKDARKRAAAALIEAKDGSDPAEAQAARRAAAARPKDTIEALVEAYCAQGMTARGRRPNYITATRAMLTNHVVSRWNGRAVGSITRAEVMKLLDEIAQHGSVVTVEGKKKRLEGGPIQANRVLAALRATFNWAIRRGLVEANPCTLVEHNAENKRARVLGDEELRAIVLAFDTLAEPFKAYFNLLLLTGQRRGEVANMRWSDVDLAVGTWTLPPESNKAGRVHVVPLVPEVVKLLKAVPGTAGGDFVFSTTGHSGLSGFGKVKKRLVSRFRSFYAH